MSDDNLAITSPIESEGTTITDGVATTPALTESSPQVLSVIEEANKELSNGGISEETYKKFSDMGLSKEMVDGAIKEQERAAIEKAFSFFEGGKAEFDVMSNWASTSFSEEQIALYDKYRVEDINKALSYLKKEYDNKVDKDNKTTGGLEPKYLFGNTAPSVEKKDVYTKSSEVFVDIKKAIKDGTYNEKQHEIKTKINNSPSLKEAK